MQDTDRFILTTASACVVDDVNIGHFEAEYEYDALGRRIEKRAGGDATRYVYPPSADAVSRKSGASPPPAARPWRLVTSTGFMWTKCSPCAGAGRITIIRLRRTCGIRRLRTCGQLDRRDDAHERRPGSGNLRGLGRATASGRFRPVRLRIFPVKFCASAYSSDRFFSSRAASICRRSRWISRRSSSSLGRN